MKYKKTILLLVLCLFALSGCTREVTFLEIHSAEELSQINNINVLDGDSGKKICSQDRELIRRLTGLLSQLKLREYHVRGDIVGYHYSISFSKDEQIVFGVVADSNVRLNIDRHYYTVLNPEIYEQFITLIADQYS